MKIKLDLTFKFQELDGSESKAEVNKAIGNAIAGHVSIGEANEANLLAMLIYNNAKPEISLAQFRLIEKIVSETMHMNILTKAQVQNYLKTIKTV